MSTEHTLRDLIRDLKKHGFSLLRNTDHGYLYGFEEYRYLVLHNLSDRIGVSTIAKQWQDWEKLKGNILRQHPNVNLRAKARGSAGDRPADVDRMEPVPDIEDGIRDEFPAIAGTEFSESTAGAEPGTANPALLGSTPATLPTAQAAHAPHSENEEEPMAKKQRKPTKIDTPCPECKSRDFGTRGSMAIHLSKGHKWSRPKIHEFFGIRQGAKASTSAHAPRGTYAKLPKSGKCPHCGDTYKALRDHVRRNHAAASGAKTPARSMPAASANGAAAIAELKNSVSTAISKLFSVVDDLRVQVEFYREDRDKLARKQEVFDKFVDAVSGERKIAKLEKMRS